MAAVTDGDSTAVRYQFMPLAGSHTENEADACLRGHLNDRSFLDGAHALKTAATWANVLLMLFPNDATVQSELGGYAGDADKVWRQFTYSSWRNLLRVFDEKLTREWLAKQGVWYFVAHCYGRALPEPKPLEGAAGRIVLNCWQFAIVELDSDVTPDVLSAMHLPESLHEQLLALASSSDGSVRVLFTGFSSFDWVRQMSAPVAQVHSWRTLWGLFGVLGVPVFVTKKAMYEYPMAMRLLLHVLRLPLFIAMTMLGVVTAALCVLGAEAVMKKIEPKWCPMTRKTGLSWINLFALPVLAMTLPVAVVGCGAADFLPLSMMVYTGMLNLGKQVQIADRPDITSLISELEMTHGPPERVEECKAKLIDVLVHFGSTDDRVADCLRAAAGALPADEAAVVASDRAPGASSGKVTLLIDE
eukprot:PLAT3330.4.p1 GENE.PLAT3330.4~~PLAT3330.4.p1  ORF type:complete len:436 (+),score=38.62 PLAT3330.4:61-1308(+)